jgi:nitroimidazol reductase NimA-like FMN-containing flavoprotein (pyridoxamine 5'-phosphate oxidase superfamily)
VREWSLREERLQRGLPSAIISLVMVIRDLTARDCVDFIAHRQLGHLACAQDDQPYVVPISFSFDPEVRCLYGFATLGKKIEWMRRNPKVSVAIDEIIDRTQWTTVVVTGRFQELGTSSADDRLRQRAMELLQERGAWWLPATAHVVGAAARETPIFYRVQIVEITGRRAGAPA